MFLCSIHIIHHYSAPTLGSGWGESSLKNYRSLGRVMKNTASDTTERGLHRAEIKPTKTFSQEM